MREARRRSRARAALSVVAASLLAATLFPVSAQVPSGAVEGRVVDSVSGAPIPGANVLVPGSLWRTTTNDRGVYHLRGVVPGRYAVRIAVIGFESVTVPVDVHADSTSHVNVGLRKAVVELAEVAVTAGAGAEKPGDTPASEAVISRNEIVNRDVLTVDQALSYVPGVILNNTDIDIRGSTGIAGGNGSRVMVMLDGHPVLSGDGESVDFSALPLLNVDRIEVVKGGYSALYGSNALGGVVNVLTMPVDQSSTAMGSTTDTTTCQASTDSPTDPSATRASSSSDHNESAATSVCGSLWIESPTPAMKRTMARTAGSRTPRMVLNPDGQHPASFYGIYKWENVGNFLGWQNPNHPYQVPPNEANDHSIAARVSLGGRSLPLSQGSQHMQCQSLSRLQSRPRQLSQRYHQPEQVSSLLAPRYARALVAPARCTAVTHHRRRRRRNVDQER